MKTITAALWQILLVTCGVLASMVDIQAQQLVLPTNPPSNAFGEVLAGYDRELAVRIGFRVEIFHRYEDGWRPTQSLAIEPGVYEVAYEMVMSRHWLALASRTLGFGKATNYIDMYRRDTQGWTFVQRLDAPLDYNGGSYLRTMALSDTTLAVGHLYKVPYTYPRVFVFDREAEGWGASYVLTPPAGSSEIFGTEISVSDEMLAVSDPRRNGTGAVVVFTRNGKAWAEAGVIGLSDPAGGRNLGRYVAACGRAVVAHTTQLSARPSVLIFTGGAHAWRLSAELIAPDDADGTFGSQMTCSESTLVIPYGAPWQHQTYATSLYTPSLRTLEVTNQPLPDGRHLCQQAVAARGDVLCASSIQWSLPLSGADSTRVVYAFNDAIDAIFSHGLE